MPFELQIDLDNINNSHVLLFQCNGFPIDDQGPAYSINSDGYFDLIFLVNNYIRQYIIIISNFFVFFSVDIIMDYTSFIIIISFQ